MALKLKVDLHVHSAEDLSEKVVERKGMLPAKDFIDLAVTQGFDALSFTHHGIVYDDSRVFDYAREKGLILIPGVETFINQRHVLLINFIKKKYVLTYQTLRRIKTPDMLVIAPHPFYKTRVCLEDDLIENIDCFDAIEYCHFYTDFINFNKKAVQIAKQYNLTIIGNSDAHCEEQFGTTFSYVYARERSVPAIIEAIKAGRVEYVTQPLSLIKFFKISLWLMNKLPYIFRNTLNGMTKTFEFY